MTSSLDYERHFGKKIDNVAKTNQVRAAEMRTLVARIVELQRKSNAIAEKCRDLHAIAEKKAKDGLEDEKEYLQAKKMNAEKRKFHDEIILLCKELGE